MLQLVLRTVLRFGGFNSSPLPTREPSARVQAVQPSPPPTKEPEPEPGRTFVRRLPTLSDACRRYRDRVLRWRLDDIGDVELAELREVMGPDLYSWLRVQVLNGDRYTWQPGDAVSVDVARRMVAQEMRTDVGLWERALVEVDKSARTARMTGKRAPEPLEVPLDIALLIEARRNAAAERTQRRARARIRQGAGEGSDGPELTPPAPPPPNGPRR